MRITIQVLCFWVLQLGVQAGVFAQTNTLFDDSLLPSIFVNMHPDSLILMVDEQVNDRYLHADFVFDVSTGSLPDTVLNIGIRLRGNTSLNAAKKSFKLSFDAFEADRKYQGVKKINLRGQHNDPTLLREKLFYEIWGKAGRPERRVSFVRFYINGEYRGLYANAEELDKTWLKRVFPDNNGNLYKCLYPADLQYLGTNQQTYKDIMHNAEDRAYRLVTNELEDDYSRFVALVEAINQPTNANYTNQLYLLLNIESVLTAFAVDVATGNWDDYFYLKNNYYLYDNPSTGRFEFITYDTDNSLGVDWLGKDWATRGALTWNIQSESRPLATKLLAVPELRYRFVTILDSITRNITCPDTIFTRIDALYSHIIEAATDDIYRTLDYDYTVEDIQKGIDDTVDGHTPYGIKPFLELRKSKTLQQIGTILSTPYIQNERGLSITPNPASQLVLLKKTEGNAALKNEYVEVFNAPGIRVYHDTSEKHTLTYAIDVSNWEEGLYWVRIGGFIQPFVVLH